MKQGTYIVNGKPATLVKITSDGLIKRTIRKVELSPERGHFYMGFVPGDAQKPKIITAQGFAYLNQFSPLAWIPQDTIRDPDGKEVGNPQDKRKSEGLVRVRRFAVGRTVDGTLRAYDLTLTYDLNAYFAADVLGKYNAKEGHGRSAKMGTPKWGQIINELSLEDHLRKNPSHGSVPIAPGIYLVFDATNVEIRKLYREHNERVRFADRFAVSVCERNILKKHFGFSTVPPNNVVEIACWEQPEFNFEKLASSVVTKNGRIVVDGEEIEAEVSDEVATTEDIEAVINDEEDAAAGEDQEDETHRPSPDKARAELRALFKMHGIKNVEPWVSEKLKSSGVGSIANLASCEDIVLMEELAQIIRNKAKQDKQES